MYTVYMSLFWTRVNSERICAPEFIPEYAERGMI